MSFGMYYRRPSQNEYWFGNQYNIDEGIIDPSASLDPLQLRDRMTSTRPDLSLGFNYSIRDNETLSLDFGVSMNHILDLDFSLFAGGLPEKYTRVSFFLSSNYKIAQRLTWVSTFLTHHQSPFRQISWRNGLMYHPEYDRDFNFLFGLEPVFTDHIDGTGIESIEIFSSIYFGNWIFDISYNLIGSDLADFNGGRGGLHFGLVYRFISTENPTENLHIY